MFFGSDEDCLSLSLNRVPSPAVPNRTPGNAFTLLLGACRLALISLVQIGGLQSPKATRLTFHVEVVYWRPRCASSRPPRSPIQPELVPKASHLLQ